MVAQIRPELSVRPDPIRMHHLRAEGGRREVDVVLNLGGGRVIVLEIKATAAPTSRDAKHLVWLRDQLGERFVRGVVFHTGPLPSSSTSGYGLFRFARFGNAACGSGQGGVVWAEIFADLSD